ncbi:MAG: hypothetical protein Q8Q59_08110 [Luteolibacter sp.]|nr:hypothetical protein [Luteolibacter sp.]
MSDRIHGGYPQTNASLELTSTPAQVSCAMNRLNVGFAEVN